MGANEAPAGDREVEAAALPRSAHIGVSMEGLEADEATAPGVAHTAAQLMSAAEIGDVRGHPLPPPPSRRASPPGGRLRCLSGWRRGGWI